MTRKKKEMPITAEPEIKDEALFVRLSSELKNALEKAAAKSRRKLRAEVEVAIEEHLERLGLWPPSPD